MVADSAEESIEIDLHTIKEESPQEPEITFDDDLMIDIKNDTDELLADDISDEDEFEGLSGEQAKDAHINRAPTPILHYDASSASLELGLSSGFVDELVKEFVQEAKSFHPKFDKAFSDDDLLTVQNLSIELKGASDNLRIHEISSALQTLLRCDNSTSGKKALDELYSLIDQL
ncbi:MAG: hypothetical protein B5M52_06510 [Helicobacteraceae bacterium 4484_230]|nr:MAG: hypothetical protein B5M52_06510 [Helicobacteraceae bacterium 4484_230]